MAGMDIQHTETSGIDKDTLLAHISRISSYRDKLKGVVREDGYNSPESAIKLPDDEAITDAVARRVDELGDVSDVIVVGMGGSVRLTQAVYQAAKRDGETTARLHVLDSISAETISEIQADLKGRGVSVDDIAICVVSKSGHTSETLANTEVLVETLSETFAENRLLERITAVTAPGSLLDKKASELGIATLSVPEQVSGRFSGLSAVGMLPLALLGIDTERLSKAASAMREACLSGRPTSDPAATIAGILFAHIEENTRIINHYMTTQNARHFGRWTEQLYAESLGKKQNRRGEAVFSGLYPVTSFAPEDLHATLQLQLGGPKNFFTIFLEETDTGGDLGKSVADKRFLSGESRHIFGHTLGEIKETLLSGTKEMFAESGRPFMTISVPQLNTVRVGQLVMLEQLVVMYLAHLLEVNAFNQPQIEGYKEAAKERLTD